MRISVITPPTVEPVTLAEAKAHCRIDIDDDNDLINARIRAAREWVENYTNRSIGQQTIEVALPAFAKTIELPRPPFRSLVFVRYLDTDDVLQSLGTDVYRTIESSECSPAVLELKPNKSVPGDVATSVAAVRIRYDAGWDTTGSPADEIPESIQQAIKILVAEMTEQGQITVTGTVQKLDTVSMLLAPYRVFSL